MVGYLFFELLAWNAPESNFNFIMRRSSIILGNGIEVWAWNTNCSTWNIMAFCIAMIWLVLGVA